jgi:Uma2 family endonuclease
VTTRLDLPTSDIPSRPGAERRILLRGVSWETFLALGDDLGDGSARLAYDRGDLELMSPSPWHERLKVRLGRLVEAVLLELGIPFEPAGETRWIREAARRGLEADESYFLDPAKLAVITGRAADRRDDPAPDLAVEVDLSEPEIDRAAIYAALGVREVWYFDGETLRIERLGDDGAYRPSESSGYLPVRADEVAAHVAAAAETDFATWLAGVRAWARDDLAARPRHGG